MRVVLHIGMEKTGTTAVQQWLDVQRKTLLEEGWHVPTRLGKTNHRQLSLLGFNADRRDDATERRNIKNDQDLVRLQSIIKRRLREEILKARENDCHTLIASSELISSRLTEHAEKERLIVTLTECGANSIQIVLVTRNPADLAESRHTTAILHEGRIENHPPYPGTSEANLFSEQGLLIEKWNKACLSAAVKAEVYSFEYELGVRREKSICTALAKYLGMSETLQINGLKIRKNEKLPNGTLELIKNINRIERMLDLIFGGSIKRHQLFDQIRKFVSCIKIGKAPYVMPSGLREKYDTYYT